MANPKIMNGIVANTPKILKENSNIGMSCLTRLKTNGHFGVHSNKNNRLE